MLNAQNQRLFDVVERCELVSLLTTTKPIDDIVIDRDPVGAKVGRINQQVLLDRAHSELCTHREIADLNERLS